MPYKLVIQNNLDLDCDSWIEKFIFKIRKRKCTSKNVHKKRYRLKRIELYVRAPFSVSTNFKCLIIILI